MLSLIASNPDKAAIMLRKPSSRLCHVQLNAKAPKLPTANARNDRKITHVVIFSKVFIIVHIILVNNVLYVA